MRLVERDTNHEFPYAPSLIVGTITALATARDAHLERVRRPHDRLPRRPHQSRPARDQRTRPVGRTDAQSGALRARALFAEHPETNAVVCGSDLIALDVCREIGKRVPEDLALTGLDDMSFSSAGDAGPHTTNYCPTAFRCETPPHNATSSCSRPMRDSWMRVNAHHRPIEDPPCGMTTGLRIPTST